MPEAARKQVRFVWLEDVDEAVAAALNPPGEHDQAEASVTAPAPSDRRVAWPR